MTPTFHHTYTDLYEDESLDLSAFHTDSTGLPFYVWLPVDMGDESRPMFMKVSPEPELHKHGYVLVHVEPTIRLDEEGSLDDESFNMLKQWIEVNRDALLMYWHQKMGIPEFVEQITKAGRSSTGTESSA